MSTLHNHGRVTTAVNRREPEVSHAFESFDTVRPVNKVILHRGLAEELYPGESTEETEQDQKWWQVPLLYNRRQADVNPSLRKLLSRASFHDRPHEKCATF